MGDDALIAEVQSLTEQFRTLMEKQPQDYIRKEEVNRIVEDIVAKLHPKQEGKFVLPVDSMEGMMERWEAFKNRPEAYEQAPKWTSEYGKKFGDIRGFINAAAIKSPLLVGEKTILTEGTPAQGGYLVPTEFSNEVIRLLRDPAIIRGIARIIPMSTWKRTFPKQLTNITASWVDEEGVKPKTKPTFTQLTQTAKKMAVIIKGSDELFRDSAINLQAFLAGLVAEAFALEEERVALVGNTGAGDPFMGVRYAAGVVAVTMGAASLVFDDIIDLEAGITGPYRRNGIYVLPYAALTLVMKLKDLQSNYIWHRPVDGRPGTINGRRYEISDQIVAVAGKYPILFGDFKRFLYISPRTGLVLKVSQEAYDAADTTNAYTQDQTWLRFVQAESIDVAYGPAFAYLDAI